MAYDVNRFKEQLTKNDAFSVVTEILSDKIDTPDESDRQFAVSGLSAYLTGVKNGKSAADLTLLEDVDLRYCDGADLIELADIIAKVEAPDKKFMPLPEENVSEEIHGNVPQVEESVKTDVPDPALSSEEDAEVPSEDETPSEASEAEDVSTSPETFSSDGTTKETAVEEEPSEAAVDRFTGKVAMADLSAVPYVKGAGIQKMRDDLETEEKAKSRNLYAEYGLKLILDNIKDDADFDRGAQQKDRNLQEAYDYATAKIFFSLPEEYQRNGAGIPVIDFAMTALLKEYYLAERSVVDETLKKFHAIIGQYTRNHNNTAAAAPASPSSSNTKNKTKAVPKDPVKKTKYFISELWNESRKDVLNKADEKTLEKAYDALKSVVSEPEKTELTEKLSTISNAFYNREIKGRLAFIYDFENEKVMEDAGKYRHRLEDAKRMAEKIPDADKKAEWETLLNQLSVETAADACKYQIEEVWNLEKGKLRGGMMATRENLEKAKAFIPEIPDEAKREELTGIIEKAEKAFDDKDARSAKTAATKEKKSEAKKNSEAQFSIFDFFS